MVAWSLLNRWFPGTVGELAAMVLETLVCLGAAVVCGMIIGLERERVEKPAGVRTHILVCLGAATFVHLGAMAHKLQDLGTLSDFNRLVQSVAVGIGFLGAGAIFREGVTVKGVTTAASIWVVGAVGAAAGAGAIGLALLVTVVSYVVLRWLFILDSRRERKGPPGDDEPDDR